MDTLLNFRLPANIGRYQIVKQIGKGAFAVVVLAYDSKTNFPVAIKIISRQDAIKNNMLNYLENELRQLSKLNHPHIVKVLDVIFEPDYINIVMDYMENGDMQGMIDRGFKFSSKEQLRILMEILEALQYLHARGISHRDIKPANILFDQEYHAKIIDFGLSHESKTLTSTFCGTPFYMAPEVIMNKMYDGMKADIWAFGVTAHIFVTSHFPFIARSELAYIKSVQKEQIEFSIDITGFIGTVIQRSLIIDPKLRASAEQLIGLINNFIIAPIPIARSTFDHRFNSNPPLPKLGLPTNYHPLIKRKRSSAQFQIAKILSKDRIFF